MNFNEFIDVIYFLSNTTGAQVLLKLLLIVILSGVIGMERAYWGKPAGFRTYALVGMSAVLVTICGEYYYNKNGSDPTRIPAQLLSGIGFLGAGTILRDGFNVKGLTTAASLLMVTCIGLVVGAGLYIGSIIATLIMYIVLSQAHKVVGKASGHFNTIDLEILIDDPKDNLDIIENVLAEYGMEILNIRVLDANKNGVDDSVRVLCKIRNISNKNKILMKLMTLEKVKQVTDI